MIIFSFYVFPNLLCMPTLYFNLWVKDFSIHLMICSVVLTGRGNLLWSN